MMKIIRHRSALLSGIILLATLGLLASCTSQPYDIPSTIHRVKKGEKIESIAKHYKISIAELRSANAVPEGFQPAPGSDLLIPAHNPYTEEIQPRVAPTRTSVVLPPPASNGNLVVSETMFSSRIGDLSWPLKGSVIRGFEGSEFGKHKGINIAAPLGSPVHAAAAGKVLYSDNQMPGYGNLVIIDHENGYTTHYAHNSRNLVKVGRRVQRGERIALVGDTGPESQPMLHFEVRRKAEAVNPIPYLPIPKSRMRAQK